MERDTLPRVCQWLHPADLRRVGQNDQGDQPDRADKLVAAPAKTQQGATGKEGKRKGHECLRVARGTGRSAGSCWPSQTGTDQALIPIPVSAVRKMKNSHSASRRPAAMTPARARTSCTRAEPGRDLIDEMVHHRWVHESRPGPALRQERGCRDLIGGFRQVLSLGDQRQPEEGADARSSSDGEGHPGETRRGSPRAPP